MTGAIAAVVRRAGRMRWTDLGGVPSGSGAVAVTTGRFAGVRRGRQRPLTATRRRAGAPGVPAAAVIFARHPLGLPAPDRLPRVLTGPRDEARRADRRGAYGGEATVLPAVVPGGERVSATRIRSRAAEGHPWHAAWPPGRPRGVPVTACTDTAVVPDAGLARPCPGRYAVTADAPGRAGTATSPTTTASGTRLPRSPAAPGPRPSPPFAGPLDPRRPQGHRCP